MSNANYFGDETTYFDDSAADARVLARRQFGFSLAFGALLLALAALVASQPSLLQSPQVGLRATISQPEFIDANPTASVVKPRV